MVPLRTLTLDLLADIEALLLTETDRSSPAPVPEDILCRVDQLLTAFEERGITGPTVRRRLEWTCTMMMTLPRSIIQLRALAELTEMPPDPRETFLPPHDT